MPSESEHCRPMKMKLLSAVPLFLWSCLVYNVQQICAQHYPSTPVSENGSVPIQSILKTPDRQAEKASSDVARSLPDHQVLPSVQELVAITDELQKKVLELTKKQGSTYVRWGRTTCPTGSTPLYTGYGAGTLDQSAGGGSNRLCVTNKPVFEKFPPKLKYAVSELAGMEYFLPDHYNTDTVCTLCRNSYAATFMVSGTNRCPSGSVLQYHGYLTGNYKNNKGGRSEYLCLDRYLQERPYTDRNDPSGYMELVLTLCGTLPCPPYAGGKVVLCAVCSV